MKKIVFYLLLGFVVFLPLGCEDNDDNLIPSSLQSKDFVWKGMNLYYLWQEQIDNLADDRFATQNELNTFLKEFTSPSTLFTSLLYERATVDKYSVIFSDYSVLEGVLTGNTKNNGVDFAIRRKPGSTTEVYGWVRYIIPGSDAASKDIQRGDLFYAINGTSLNVDNYLDLISTDSYTLNLADYNGGAITPNGQSVALTKTVLAENPILVNSVLTEGDKKIGYLMYNGFFSAYDNQLNTVFGNFSAQGVTDLVLDLRYNSGGAVTSATKLASMITGQFDGQLFAREQWNSKAQAYFLANNPTRLENKFVSGLNGLNLTKVYVLTSKSSASATELVINCLKPYIQVVQIGDVTAGKNVGSITLYDSPTFAKTDVNKSHKYAMQPIVLKIVNKNGVGDYTAGITPDHELFEDMEMLGVLGDGDEKLLNKAITLITGSGRMTNQPTEVKQRDLTDSKALQPLRSEMYVEMK
ncbi:MAG TPA: S41 family peptidase [Flavobacterium sp.]|nr:S41 family peptidase [Flavobacterium sp.]